MDFWADVKKTINRKLPEFYSFLLSDSRKLINVALALSAEQREEMIEKCQNRVNDYQYAVGGETLHRGYYCPSLIRDIVVGNCNRGKLMNTTKKATYEYGFCDGQLMTVKHNIDSKLFEIEYITYFDNKQIGYVFDNEMRLKAVSECIYFDKKLVNYFLVNYEPLTSSVICEKEIYDYDNNLLNSVEVYSMQAENNCYHNKYIFNHDSEGYLVSYKVDEYENGNINDDFYWKDHLFKITLKRKV